MNSAPNSKTVRARLANFLAAGAVLVAACTASAQTLTTNAFDTASDPAYYNCGAPNGLSPGAEDGGTGFGAWTFDVIGNGGAFIANNGPSGSSFDLWNTGSQTTTLAVRSFNSPLTAGSSFSFQFRLNSLDSATDTNAIALQDQDGNTLFTYFHTGGDNLNGHYSDATVTNGAAVGFHYDYQQFDSFTFTVNSATTYTFTDNTTGASVSGFLSGAEVAQFAFIRANGNPTGNGQDFQFDNLLVTSTAVPAPPGFQQATPAPNSFDVATTNGISVLLVPGGAALNSSSVKLSLDGVSVTPTVTPGTGGALTVTYQPASPLTAATTHTVQVMVKDSDNTSYTNNWSFTTVFPTLPAVLPGPFAVSNNSDLVIFSAADAWLGANYGPNSSQTLYARFSMAFPSLNPGGTEYGGFEFYQDGTEKLLAGKSSLLDTWSTGAGAPNDDILPSTEIASNDWHTIVLRLDYQDGGEANVSAWLDPDFTMTEANQPNAPLTFSMDNSFNNIHLRGGFGTLSAAYSNIIISATSPGAGFAAPQTPQFQNFVPGVNAGYASPSTPVSVTVIFGSYGIGTNSVALDLDGSQVTPFIAATTNSLTVSYQPPTAFALGSSHNVMVGLVDSNGAAYSANWSFTVDAYPSLPVVAPGPFDVNGGFDDILWVAQNGWIGTNYGPTSSNTLYSRFSMTFFDLNGETGNGGGYGGLHFFDGDNEVFLIGNAWISTNWSIDDAGNEEDITPVTPIVLGEWDTFVVKTQFEPNANAQISIWFNPDFTKTEANQPIPPFTISANSVFDNIRLRCGNGTASAEFTNVVMAANAADVGFVPAASSLTFSATKQLSWTGTGTLQNATALTGPWSNAANQGNPQVIATTNAAMFFRLRQ